PARDLTPFDNVQAQIYAVSKRDPKHILIGLNDRDASLHDVYRLNLSTGKRELLFKNDQNVATWVCDLEGKLRAPERVTTDGGTGGKATQAHLHLHLRGVLRNHPIPERAPPHVLHHRSGQPGPGRAGPVGCADGEGAVGRSGSAGRSGFRRRRVFTRDGRVAGDVLRRRSSPDLPEEARL